MDCLEAVCRLFRSRLWTVSDHLWTVSDGMIMPKICGTTIPKFKE